MSRSTRINIFKWGYEGWGNATKTLVRCVDALERQDSYEPPMFVDIHYSRSVRAIGFRDQAFEKLLGHKRYRWMRSLGNAAIRSRRGGMRIQCPDAAEQLLDLAIDAAAANKRIIFFCSCPSPHGAEWCHRTKVAKLLLRVARRRQVAVEIEEWPGGIPARTVGHRVHISEAELRKVRQGAVNVSITPQQATADLAGLPWGALVELVARGERQVVSVGPPQYRAKRWWLPVFLVPVEEGDSAARLTPFVHRLRSSSKLDALRS